MRSILLGNSSFPLFVLFIFEVLSFLQLSLFNVLLSFLLLILSCSNLLSSLYIMFKYFFTHFYSPVIDLLLIILSIPIISIIIFMGLNLLLPIHFLL